MTDYKFQHPIEVRYGDLDPQGHLNNAKYLTYFEQARIQYMVDVGLFVPGHSFLNIGVIIADIHITFLAPVLWGEPVAVGVKTIRMGNKSMTAAQNIVNTKTGVEVARGEVVLVAFDYRTEQTTPIPDEWRKLIQAYEGQ